MKKPGGHHGGDWTARVSVTSDKGQRNGEDIALVFYAALEDKANGQINAALGSHVSGIEGSTEGLGLFRLSLSPTRGTVEEHSFLVTVAPGLQVLKEVVLHNLKLAGQKGSAKKHIVLAGEQLSSSKDGKKLNPNLVASQVTAKIPFELEISFESGSFDDRGSKLVTRNLDAALSKRRREFHDKFERTFALAAKGYDEDQVKFAKAAFSNMLGGVGYFYGSAQVRNEI